MPVTSEPEDSMASIKPSEWPDGSNATPGGSSVPPTGRPSRNARVLAFLAIVGGGLLGAVIGAGLANATCDASSCARQAFLGALIGGIACAVGVGIVATLALRAMGEWHTIRARDHT